VQDDQTRCVAVAAGKEESRVRVQIASFSSTVTMKPGKSPTVPMRNWSLLPRRSSTQKGTENEKKKDRSM
jgi:hypothetical protein